MMKVIRASLFTALLVYLSYLAVSIIFFIAFTHDEIVSLVKTRNPHAYRIDQYGVGYFSVEHYQFVSRIAPFLVLILVALIGVIIWQRLKFFKLLDCLFVAISALKEMVYGAFIKLTKTELLFFCAGLVSLLVIKVYLFWMLPFHVDEAFNFVYFVDHGIFHSTVFANNHVLTNSIAAIWWKIGLPPELSFRLTSILASLAIHVLIFAITTRFYGARAGMFVMMLTGVAFWTNIYAVEGVGYMLTSLWFIIACFSIFYSLESDSYVSPLFILSGALGFYTSQLFLIPFISLIIFWIISSAYNGALRKSILRIAICAGMTLVITAALYTPMYLWSGPNSVIHSDVAKHDLIFMMPLLFESFSVATDMHRKSYYLVILVVIAFLYYFRALDKPAKTVVTLFISVCISVVIFSLIAHLYPPSRALVFANFVFYGLCGILLMRLSGKFASQRTGTVILCLLLVIKLSYSVYIYKFGWQHQQMGLQDNASYAAVNRLANQILSGKPNVIFSDEHDAFLNFYLLFNALKTNQRVDITHDTSQKVKADIIIINSEGVEADENYETISDDNFGIVKIKLQNSK